MTTMTDSREEWLTARRAGIGGSDAAAIVGRNPWASPMSVYLDKIGELPQAEASEAMYWGTRLEDTVAEEFRRRLSDELGTDVELSRADGILVHPDYDWMLGNIDRWASVNGSRAVLECKTTSAWNLDAWEDSRVPVPYYLQLQHYLAVTGLELGYLAVLIGGQTYKHYPVPRSNGVIAWLIEEEGRFWHQHVVPRVPPPVDGSEATRKALDRLYPAAREGFEIELPDAADLVEQYRAATEAAKLAEEEKRKATNAIKALMGDAEVAYIGDARATWKERRRKAYQVEEKTYRHFQIYGGGS